MSDLLRSLAAANTVPTRKAMPLEEYFDACTTNPMMYATAATRLRAGIGERTLVDTSKDPRLNRIFGGDTIPIYPAFSRFYGLERTIDRLVGFVDSAAQGHRQYRQMMLLVGPPSSGKSSLTARLLSLMETHPYYALMVGDEVSPISESPLGLFTSEAAKKMVSEQYRVPYSRLTGLMSPWAFGHLQKSGGDLSIFKVVEVWPSLAGFNGIAKVDPPTHDITGAMVSPLVQGLRRTAQGMLEVVEIFNHPHEHLAPLLTATEERMYMEDANASPYGGFLVAHCNRPAWTDFKDVSLNAGLVDRVFEVPVRYIMRATEERRMYEDFLAEAGLDKDLCAPDTLDLLASLSVLSRLAKTPDSGKGMSIVGVYDGKDPSEVGSTQTLATLRTPVDGEEGLSPRFLGAQLANTLAADTVEGRADPVQMFATLESALRGTSPKDAALIQRELKPAYLLVLAQHIREAYFESYAGHVQNKMQEYLDYVDAWCEDTTINNPDTGAVLTKGDIEAKLRKDESQAGINRKPDELKTFRNVILRFSLRAGHSFQWTDATDPDHVALARGFAQISDADLYKRINFETRREAKEALEHDGFVQRMQTLFGYTPRQVRRLVGWYITEAKLKPPI